MRTGGTGAGPGEVCLGPASPCAPAGASLGRGGRGGDGDASKRQHVLACCSYDVTPLLALEEGFEAVGSPRRLLMGMNEGERLGNRGGTVLRLYVHPAPHEHVGFLFQTLHVVVCKSNVHPIRPLPHHANLPAPASPSCSLPQQLHVWQLELGMSPKCVWGGDLRSLATGTRHRGER